MRSRFYWWVWIPLAVLASMLASVAVQVAFEMVGAWGWLVWSASGAAAGTAFFWVALDVAPAASPRAKWVWVLLGGILGLNTLYFSYDRGDREGTLTGIAIIACVAYFGRIVALTNRVEGAKATRFEGTSS